MSGGTWFKVEDQVTEDPRYAGLSSDAWALWLHGTAYVARNLTDGWIQASLLPRLAPATMTPKRLAAARKELVEVGLWTHDVDGLIEVVGYLDLNRSRAKVEQERKAGRARVAKWRAQAEAAERSSNAPSDARSNAVTGAVSNATREEVEGRGQSSEEPPLEPKPVTTSIGGGGLGEDAADVIEIHTQRSEDWIADAPTSAQRAQRRALVQTGKAPTRNGTHP